jgi:hypothetical protein
MPDSLTFRAPKGLQDSAWGFNPRNQPPPATRPSQELEVPSFQQMAPASGVLTRHMNVRSRKNTRSPGLEVLKGRHRTRFISPISLLKPRRRLFVDVRAETDAGYTLFRGS